MSTTQPIRNKQTLQTLKEYYKTRNPNLRNYTLVIMGLNTALRISDILNLTCDMVYENGKPREHIIIREQKTGKTNQVLLNKEIRHVLKRYIIHLKKTKAYKLGNPYLFPSPYRKNQHLSRFQAYRIIRSISDSMQIKEHISCHSLRKTFGYYAWKQGADPIVIMMIYNHSSFAITKRYLCIEQDDKDEIYRKIIL